MCCAVQCISSELNSKQLTLSEQKKQMKRLFKKVLKINGSLLLVLSFCKRVGLAGGGKWNS